MGCSGLFFFCVQKGQILIFFFFFIGSSGSLFWSKCSFLLFFFVLSVLNDALENIFFS